MRKNLQHICIYNKGPPKRNEVCVMMEATSDKFIEKNINAECKKYSMNISDFI